MGSQQPGALHCPPKRVIPSQQWITQKILQHLKYWASGNDVVTLAEGASVSADGQHLQRRRARGRPAFICPVQLQCQQGGFTHRRLSAVRRPWDRCCCPRPPFPTRRQICFPPQLQERRAVQNGLPSRRVRRIEARWSQKRSICLCWAQLWLCACQNTWEHAVEGFGWLLAGWIYTYVNIRDILHVWIYCAQCALATDIMCAFLGSWCLIYT